MKMFVAHKTSACMNDLPYQVDHDQDRTGAHARSLDRFKRANFIGASPRNLPCAFKKCQRTNLRMSTEIGPKTLQSCMICLLSRMFRHAASFCIFHVIKGSEEKLASSVQQYKVPHFHPRRNVFLRSCIRYWVSSYRATYNYEVLTQLQVVLPGLLTQPRGNTDVQYEVKHARPTQLPEHR